MVEYGYPIMTRTRTLRCHKCNRYISSRTRHKCDWPNADSVSKVEYYDELYDHLMGRIKSEHEQLWFKMNNAAFVYLPQAGVCAAVGRMIDARWFTILFSASCSVNCHQESLYESPLGGPVYVNVDASVVYLTPELYNEAFNELPVQKWLVLPIKWPSYKTA